MNLFLHLNAVSDSPTNQRQPLHQQVQWCITRPPSGLSQVSLYADSRTQLPNRFANSLKHVLSTLCLTIQQIYQVFRPFLLLDAFMFIQLPLWTCTIYCTPDWFKNMNKIREHVGDNTISIPQHFLEVLLLSFEIVSP